MAEIDATAPPVGSGISAGNSATTNTTNLAAMLTYLIGQGGGTLYIPSGVYKINGNVLKRINESLPVRITIRGDGPDSSIFSLDGDVAESVFLLRSDEGFSADGYLQVRDLQLQTQVASNVRKRATWFHFYRTEHVRFDRVHFLNTAGSCIHGFGLRYATFVDVHFNRCGDRDSSEPMIVLSAADDQANKSEIIFFDACRIENNHHVCVRLNDVRSVFFLSTKFHGVNDTAVPNANHPEHVNHVEINNADGVFFTSCRFTNSGRSHVVALNASMTLVNSSCFDAADEYGISSLGCVGTVIVCNNFAAGPSGTSQNVAGDLLEVECTNTKYTYNAT